MRVSPSVSILLPCRDAEAYLPECIGSLRAQTLTGFEVVAVDDGSTDATFQLLQSWAAADRRVRVYRTGPRGIAPALATAQAFARAPLIARMDADDRAEPARHQRQVDHLANPALSACGTGVHYFPREEIRDGALRYEAWINGLAGADDVARNIFVECPIAHPTLMIRRSALLAVGGYRDMGWPEDYDLVLRLWAAGYRMANVPEVLHHWRERADRASRTDGRYSVESFRRCKVHFLRRTLLAGRSGAVVVGAGPVGKALARELLAQDVRLHAFADLDPRKIGQSIYDVPVIPNGRVLEYREGLFIGAVGSPGGRENIRLLMQELGLNEMEDFCVAA